jgi:DNA-binding MarR family transcriptional regulator
MAKVGRELVLEQPHEMAVMVSPVRQEILAVIGLHGPVGTAALARHLGRTQTSLYHHLVQLVRIGAIASSQVRRSDGRLEQVFATAVGRVRFGSDASKAAVAAQRAAGRAALRLATRELVAAISDRSLRRTGPTRELVAMRGKSWFDAAQLRELNTHIRAIEALLRRGAAKRKGARPYAVSVVLTPSEKRSS